MKLQSASFFDGKQIPEEFAFAICDPLTHVTLGQNKSPQLSWTDVPAETRSLVLLCVDPDAPASTEDVNLEDRVVLKDAPRTDFFHWVMVDIPPSIVALKEGEFSKEVTPRGKAGPATLYEARHGVNSYTAWFAEDHDMNGDYFGYDGPCPPWNDELPHRYVFTLYATDFARFPVEGAFTGQMVRELLRDHVLAEACATGFYSLNPKVIKDLSSR